jgi:hypothetical protein
MEKIADARSPGNQYADPWERLKKLDVVEKGRTKPIRSVWVLGADVVQNDLKID